MNNKILVSLFPLLMVSQAWASHANNQFVVDDQFMANSTEPQLFDVLKNDIGDNLKIESVLTGDGDFVITDNKVLFTPSSETLSQEHPQGKFGYTVKNKEGIPETGIAIITYELSSNNHSPIAMDDHTYATTGDKVIVNVLKNDYDPDEGDVLIVSEALSYDAVVEIQDNGNIRVNRLTDKTPIEVTYNLSDQYGDHDYGKLTIDYVSNEDLIIAMDDQFNNMPINTSFTLNVLENDIIANDHTVISKLISKENVVQINNGLVTFTPSDGFNYSAPYKFGYTIKSDDHYDDGIVTINFHESTINNAPITHDDIIYANSINPIKIAPLMNDIDPDGDPLTIIRSFSEDGETSITDDHIIFTPSSILKDQDVEIIYEITDGNGEYAYGRITLHYGKTGDNQCVYE
ncbi:Ig-like domain-containing protein [Photobacterium indicum]|uniref:Ig-like domain-containing protein n=1 Tax=Photobacterium indicum TaxID=81447 RepID=UPI003D0F5313